MRLPALVPPSNSCHAIPLRPRAVRAEHEAQHEFVARTRSLSVCTRSGFPQRDRSITHKRPSSKPFKLTLQSAPSSTWCRGKADLKTFKATRDLLERFLKRQNALSCMRQVRTDDQHGVRQHSHSHPTYPRSVDLRAFPPCRPSPKQLEPGTLSVDDDLACTPHDFLASPAFRKRLKASCKHTTCQGMHSPN